MNLSVLAKLLSAEFSGQDQLIKNIIVSTDTRSIKNGSIFVALRGERFDGHDFIDEAFSKGASAVIVDQKFSSDNQQTYPALIIVADTLTAYGTVAQHHLNQFSVKKVAITGSCGKTSVKEILSSMLSVAGEVLATQGNLNNAIGVPHTLLAVQKQHDFAVVEMGANHIGEIAYLSTLVQPQVAALLNADRAHLEGFGSIEGVVKAKGEIFSGVQAGGKAVLSLDEKHFSYWRDLVSERGLSLVTTSMTNTSADIYLIESQQATQAFELKVMAFGECHNMRLPLLGQHNIKNTLTALAIAYALGLSIENIIQGLSNTKAAKGRLNTSYAKTKQTQIDYLIIDDTYNANPLSVRAAIDVLADYQYVSNQLRILVLGDMAELGEESLSMHGEMGAYAQEKQIDVLLSCGPLSKSSFEAFKGRGKAYSTQQDLINSLSDWLPNNDPCIFLVKGSRSAKMEEVVSALENYGDAA